VPNYLLISQSKERNFMTKILCRIAIVSAGIFLLVQSDTSRELLILLTLFYLLTMAAERILKSLAWPQMPIAARIFKKLFDFAWSGFEQRHIDGGK
jgi:hypothetical protein